MNALAFVWFIRAARCKRAKCAAVNRIAKRRVIGTSPKGLRGIPSTPAECRTRCNSNGAGVRDGAPSAAYHRAVTELETALACRDEMIARRDEKIHELEGDLEVRGRMIAQLRSRLEAEERRAHMLEAAHELAVRQVVRGMPIPTRYAQPAATNNPLEQTAASQMRTTPTGASAGRRRR
jgi:hypothetical protein